MLARRRFIALILFAALPAFLLAAGDEPDLAIVAKIRHEGIKRSQVMRLAGYLSDVIGPRPAGSPANDRANRWAADTMKGWGLENVALEPYGTFGVGWAPRYVSAHLLSPHYAPLQAISVEWGSSTKGKITGEPLYVSIATPADLARYRGKLKGRIVLYQPPRRTAPHFTADAHRHDAGSLEALASYPIPDEDPPSADYVRGFLDELEEFFRTEDVGVLVSPSSGGRGDYGTTVAAGIRSARHPDRPRPLPEIILAVEHYNRIVRIIDELPRAGDDGGRSPERVLRQGPSRLQRRRRDSRHRQEGRGRDAGRPHRLVEPRHRRRRQCGRRGGVDGGGAHPESDRRPARGARSASCSGAPRKRAGSDRRRTSPTISRTSRR